MQTDRFPKGLFMLNKMNNKIEQSKTPDGSDGGTGTYTEIYTLSSDEHLGRDNLGHCIPELLTVPDECLTTTASSQQLTQQSSSSVNMTPLTPGPRIGKRTILTFDGFIIIIVATCILSVEFGFLPHVKTGFYCNDPKLSFKLNGELISTAVILTSILIPFFIIWIAEAIYYKSVSIKSSRLKKSFSETTYWFNRYFIGMILHILVVEMIKITIGEQRPHFLDTCKPDAAVNCTQNEYISQYQCTNTVDSFIIVRDSSKSFPSGHASISFFEAIFLIWYLHKRAPPTRSHLLYPILKTLLLIWACLCSASRITDHRHHWWDVLFGMAIGICFAILTCLILCKNFKRKTVEVIVQNGNSDRHTSVRRLLSDVSCRDEVTMNHVAAS